MRAVGLIGAIIIAKAINPEIIRSVYAELSALCLIFLLWDMLELIIKYYRK